MENVKRTTEISSNISRGCEHCHANLASRDQDITDRVNHYIEEHGYRVLHVGPETIHGSDGKPWHTTVAVLGHDNPPAVLPPPKIVFRGMDEGDVKLKS